VEWLHRRAHVPRSVGVIVHYLGFLAAVGLFLYLVVPVAITQVDHAIGHVPTSQAELHRAATHSHGIRHDILSALDKRLRQLPSGASLLHPAITVTKTLFEILIGILFMFAVGAYWIFDRDGTIALVQSMVPRRHRRVTRDTWVLIDKKLGAFVRGQFLLVLIVATLLSFAFWLDGLPYWLLIGAGAGVVEVVPSVGPSAAARGRRAGADRRAARRGRGCRRSRTDRQLGGRARGWNRGARPTPARGLRHRAS